MDSLAERFNLPTTKPALPRQAVLREARIIIPTAVPATCRIAAESMMIAAFGGFTSHPAIGAWRDGNKRSVIEDTLIYDIAVDAVPDSGIKLHQIATYIRNHGSQDCVYLRTYDGTVSLV